MTSPELPPVDAALVDFAVEVVHDAGKATLSWFQDAALSVDAKGDGTPVTAADRAAERLVRERIAERFPEDGILGEEEPERLGTSGRRWIVDPIDGTKGFTRGVPLYATLLALDDEHGPAVGVIGLPALGQVVHAGRGRGCVADGVPARVSDIDRLGDAYVTTTGYSSWPEASFLGVQRSGAAMRGWGDGYGYALVATGRVDAMVDHRAEVYDVAAMPVILAEAGGRFTSVSGRPGASGGSGVATNGRLHDELLSVLAEPSPASPGG